MIDLEQIVTLDDLPFLENYLADWMAKVNPAQLMKVDVTGEDEAFNMAVEEIKAIAKQA